MPAFPTLAVAPLAGLALLGTTDQVHQSQRGTLQATVAADARSLDTLVVDGLLRCDGDTLDPRTFTVTAVRIGRQGAFRARGRFEQPVTSADGRPVTARYRVRLRGRFTSPRRLTGTLTARAAYVVDGRTYARCRSGTVTFTGSAPRAAAAPSA